MDAITDPIYGFLINLTPPTRYGKFKPWYVFFKYINFLC